MEKITVIDSSWTIMAFVLTFSYKGKNYAIEYDNTGESGNETNVDWYSQIFEVDLKGPDFWLEPVELPTEVVEEVKAIAKEKAKNL